MSNLQTNLLDPSSTRNKATREARETQASIVEECANNGQEPPPYTLSELVGKGSFGRVYKATGKGPVAKLVAVKIISIEDGDSHSPGGVDTFRDILQEVNTLKFLSDGGARNINAIIDTLLVGQSIWLVTEYCEGGSVASLLRPTGGLAEIWIVPILREVAVALHWVHKQAVIHRDVKCANVLVTEAGGVQLCDFGVAGIIETKFDKRSTVTGTLQWMAPELFDSSVAYGIEVDIWAFGSMAYEMATGLPPNAASVVDVAHFGSYLRQNAPRLHGDQYSSRLKNLIAYCLTQDPMQRPCIEEVQQHPYIAGTEKEFPTASLSKLVHSYKLWEAQGGMRHSLFSAGGAQAMSSNRTTSADVEWNFDTMDNTFMEPNSDAQAVYDVFGPQVDFPQQKVRPLPSKSKAPHRRHIPPNIKPLRVPLEKVFDSNATSNYDENAHVFYGRHVLTPTSCVPSRDDSRNVNVRESLIDLDAALEGSDSFTAADSGMNRPFSSGLAGHGRTRPENWKFPAMDSSTGSDITGLEGKEHNRTDLDTIKPTPRAVMEQERPRTQDWTFPVAAASRTSRLTENADWNPAFGGRLRGEDVDNSKPMKEGLHRSSTVSLIDLDDGFHCDATGMERPSTAESDTTSNLFVCGNTTFGLERHLSIYPPQSPDREPSIYVPDGRIASTQTSDDGERALSIAALDDVGFSKEAPILLMGGTNPQAEYIHQSGPHSPQKEHTITPHTTARTRPFTNLAPSIPSPPSVEVLLAKSSPAELKSETRRLISSLSEHFRFASDTLQSRAGHRGP